MENNLPLGWTQVTLEEITNSINSGFPCGAHNSEGRGVPHLRPMNVTSSGKISLADTKYVETAKYDSLLKGDVLFNNTNSSDLVGKTAYIKEDKDWAYSNHMTRIRFNQEHIEASLISYYLHHLFYIGYFKANCNNHVSQASISTKFLSKEVSIPLPPLAEQKRIVAKLDAVMEKVEASKERLARIPQILKQFRQSVLAAAVSGRLTAEWRKKNPDVESAEEVMLIDIIQEKPRNGYSPQAVDYETNVKSLTLTATTSGKFNPKYFKYLDIQPSADSHLWLRKGDILIQRGNTIEYVGVSAVYNGEENKFIYPDLMMKIRVNEKALSKYVHYSLLNLWLNKYFQERATGTSGNMPKINQGVVMNIPIFLPSIKEQQEIVRRVEELFTLADSIEARYEAAKAQLDQLPQAILAKAFRGELVPQDPNDEPASVLLERIQAEKSGKGKTSKAAIQSEIFA